MDTYILKILFNYSFSDPIIEQYQLERKYKYTRKEVTEFYKSIGTLYNPHADELFNFFIQFKDGLFYPEKCGLYEPIKQIFTPEDIPRAIKILSDASTHYIVTRGRRFFFEFTNWDHGFWWEDNEPMTPKFERFDLFELRGVFYKSKKGIALTDAIEFADSINERFNPFFTRIIDYSNYSGEAWNAPQEAILYEPQTSLPEVREKYIKQKRERWKTSKIDLDRILNKVEESNKRWREEQQKRK